MVKKRINQKRNLSRPSSLIHESPYHHHLRVHLRIGIAILLVFTGLKIGLMHTGQGRWLAAQAYEWLHGFSSGRGHSVDLPVVLMDISNLKPEKLVGSEGESRPEFTPRRELERLVKKLASVRQTGHGSPVAVGFDLDFSPETDGFIPVESFRFFDFCLNAATNGLPVILGVRRTETLGESAWLGSLKYTSLAASISRPKGPVRQMPYAYQFGNSSRRLPSFCAALAQPYWEANANSETRIPWFLKSVVEDVSEVAPLKDLADFRLKMFYVDFSQRAELEQTKLDFQQVLDANPAVLERLLKNKLVIVGDVRSSESRDTAVIPGEAEPVSGIYAQACAVCTLTRGHLYVMNHWLGLIVAAAMSLSEILFIHLVSVRFSRRMEVVPTALQVLLSVVLLAATLFLAWLLMAVFRVLWLEVFSVMAILLAHAMVEIFVGSANWNELAPGRGGLWHALLKGNHYKNNNE